MINQWLIIMSIASTGIENYTTNVTAKPHLYIKTQIYALRIRVIST